MTYEQDRTRELIRRLLEMEGDGFTDEDVTRKERELYDWGMARRLKIAADIVERLIEKNVITSGQAYKIIHADYDHRGEWHEPSMYLEYGWMSPDSLGILMHNRYDSPRFPYIGTSQRTNSEYRIGDAKKAGEYVRIARELGQILEDARGIMA
ncbi:MAG: hypothetical protein HYW22_00985 [Candidatus Aenigmarchaeota archaeon]|nr:hypothetical protein [Candidatus Aenigmarchaeota archaeon]